MKFTYTYRSSDGERHTAEIEAESRDAAFGRLRTEYGIKPIKVTAAGQEPGRQDQDSQDTQDAQDTQETRMPGRDPISWVSWASWVSWQSWR